jgi:uncharacterized membrane protein HdeD (DUF308 family)
MMAGRGVLAVLFGAAIALWRIPVFDAAIVSFGTYAIADGILAIASALRAARPLKTGWPIALEGIISICFGGWRFRAARSSPGRGCADGICEIVAVGCRSPPTGSSAPAVPIFLALLVLGLPRRLDRRARPAVYAIVFGTIAFVTASGGPSGRRPRTRRPGDSISNWGT